MALSGGFSEDSMRRISRVVRKVERLQIPDDQGYRRNAATNQPHWECVQIIDLEPDVDDEDITRYQGRIEAYDSDTDEITLFPEDPDYIWVVLENGATPELEKTYEARRQGDHDGRAVFRTAGGGGQVAEALDFHAFAQVSGGQEGILAPGSPVGNYPKVGAPAAGIAIGLPMIFPLAVTPEWLGVYLSTPGDSGAKVRIGVYLDGASSGNTGLWNSPSLPDGELVYETELTLDVGPGGYYPFVGSPPFTFEANCLYWIFTLFNSVGVMPIVGKISTDAMMSIMGTFQYTVVSPPWQVAFGWKATRSYGAFGADWSDGSTDAGALYGSQDCPVALMKPESH
jgi:hypothetical protein